MEFKGIIKEMFKEKQSQIDMRICLSGSAFAKARPEGVADAQRVDIPVPLTSV